jgi:tRNA1Val (adenine37-N6)-methyltransferase
VEDSKSTMRVGTDSMLLGSWVNPAGARSILDVGTGCGILSLMMAQKSQALIDAIEIHQPSVEEARNNFLKSPWADRINVYNASFQEFSGNASLKYDLIISNPPFFSNSLKPASGLKLISRHEKSLSFQSLIDCSVAVMSADSSLCLVLPPQESRIFIRLAEIKNLYPQKTLLIRPGQLKPPNRVLLRFGFAKNPFPGEEELVISTPDRKFTEDYLSLTNDFHFFTQKDS